MKNIILFHLYSSFLAIFVLNGVDQVAPLNVERSTYIIHMNKYVKPKSFKSHKSWYHSTVKILETMNESFSPSIQYTYQNVVHGFSAVLSLEELGILKTFPGFLSSYKDKTATLLTTRTSEFMSLNRLSGIWPVSNYGENVIIGVIDSGIWPENDSFKDDGMTPPPLIWKRRCAKGQNFNASMCNSKLIAAQYFNKGVLANQNPGFKLSMNSARDTNGHGTQTSQAIAGNYVHGASYFGYGEGEAKGTAPRARISMYKIGWKEGIYASDILAGMDRAIADEVDIICLAIYMEDDDNDDNPISIASFAAMEKNILVLTPSGNKGPSLWTLSNGFPWVLTVGAGTIDRFFSGTLVLGNGSTIIGWTLFRANPIIQNLPLIYDNTISSCDSHELLAKVLSGIIICDQITSVFNQITHITYSSNIHAAILISNDPNLSETEEMACPCIVLSPKDASLLIEYVKTSDEPRASITFQKTILGTKPAPIAASFSSRGPSPIFPSILKPEVIAPGTLILAASIPTLKDGQIGENVMSTNQFDMVSGTSISCAVVTGVCALLKHAYRHWSPAAIRSALMTTANTLDNTYQPISDNGVHSLPASPFAIGAGHIDPNRALDPGLIYDINTQDYINLLCSMPFTRAQILRITRSKSYTCLNPSSDLNYPSFIALYDTRTNLMRRRTFQRTVTNVGDGHVTYNAYVHVPPGFAVRVLPTTLTFEKKNEKQNYTVTIDYKWNYKKRFSYGDLIWTEANGRRRWVRSPIIIAQGGKFAHKEQLIE